MEGIRNLIFDFGGVLINLDRQRCVSSFRKMGLENVEEFISPYTQQDIFKHLEEGSITASEFRDKVREIAGDLTLSDRKIDKAWNSFLLDIPPYKLEALLKLREKYMVYLLSNTNEIHWQWACQHAFPHKRFRVEDYFEQIFLSYEMHQVKPGTGIFETVIETTGINPQETLFIDDSPDNCQAAASLNIRTYTAKPGEDWRHLFF